MQTPSRLLTLAGCAVIGAAVSAAEVTDSAYLTSDKLVYTVGGKATTLAVKADTVSWTELGRFLVCLGGDRLTVVNPVTKELRTVGGVVSFRPSPDGTKVAIATTQGTLEVRSLANTASAVTVATSFRAGSYAWSPNQQSLVYARGQEVFSYDLKSNREAKLASGKEFVCLSWSRDGRLVAGADTQGRVFVFRPNGTGVTLVGNSNATSVEWSPNGRFLLCETEHGFEVLQPTRGSDPVACDAITRPTWVEGQKLVVVRDGQATKRYWDMQDRDVEFGKVPEGAVAWAYRPKLVVSNDQTTGPSPFAKASRPSPGQFRAEAYVDTIDPMAMKMVVLVESWTDSRGRETNYPDPVAVEVTLSDEAVHTDGKARRRLLPTDMLDGDHVSLLLTGDAPNRGGPQTLKEAWIEGAEVVAGKPVEGSPGEVPELPASFKAAPHLTNPTISDGVATDKIVVPIIFPLAGVKGSYSNDFFNPRSGGRKHHGTDVFGSKMTQLVAAFDGKVRLIRNRGLSGNGIYLYGDNGWTACYFHVNNDTPGTDDGRGGDQFAFAPGIDDGVYVKAGQFIGYLGDSGNAEGTPPHCHFELRDQVAGVTVNPYHSLKAAVKLQSPGEVVVPVEPVAVTVRSLPSAVERWRPMVEKHATPAGLDPDLILAVIATESSGDPNNFTPNRRGGAFGLMQLLPEDCQKYGVPDPYQPEDNIRGGIAHLSDYLRMFGGDLEKGLIAYNAGPSRVRSGSWTTIKEAREYVPKVRRYYRFPADGRSSSVASRSGGRATRTKADPGKRADSPIVLLPPVSEPTPVRLKAELELMASVLRAQNKEVALDPKLAKLAADAAKNLAEGLPLDSVESVAKLGGIRAGFTRLKVHAFSTAKNQGFAERWAQLRAKPGAKVGLGVEWLGDRPHWCVVTVE